MKTAYQKIDIDAWKLKEHFTAYRGAVKCGFRVLYLVEIKPSHNAPP